MKPLVVGLFTLCAAPALAQTDSFHLNQIEQVLGGIDGNTSMQAVQLRARFFGENFLAPSRLIAHDAAGNNPVLVIDFQSSVPNGELGDRVLIVSSGWTPPVAADFEMTSPIPASYMAAGRLTFEDDFGTILWSLAWGGAAYTGPTTGSITNHPTGQFGPAWSGPLPTADTRALLFQGPAAALGGSNSTDYALTTGAAVLTNNARASGAVGTTPCYPDCNGDGALNLADFGCFQTAFAGGNAYADCNGDTILNLADFGCFQTEFALGCP